MNTLNLRVTGNNKFNKSIYVDGAPVKFKSNKFGSDQAVITTDKDQVDITIVKYLELAHKWWWWMSIVFFIISIFGIFDSGYDRYCYVIDCKFNVKLKQNEATNVAIAVNTPTKKKKRRNKNIQQTQDTQANAVKYITISSESEVVEEKNNCYQDKKIKRRYNIVLVAKIICWIGLLIGLVFAIVPLIK